MARRQLFGSVFGSDVKYAQSTTTGATARATGGAARNAYAGVTSNIDQVITRQYERILWVFRCVDFIATKASSLPIIFLNGGRDPAKFKPVTLRDLDVVFNKMSNPHETAKQFRYRLSTLGQLSDLGVFIEIVRNNAGGIASLHILPPGRVQPIPDAENFIAGYRVMNGEEVIDFLSVEQVLWIKFKPHPTDPYKQMTPLVAAKLTTETEWLTRLYNRNFVMNDGRPSMLITVDGLNPDDADRLKMRFEGGPGRAGETSVLDGGGINVADLTVNPRDMMYLESLRGSKEEILLAFGVPESQLGNASGQTFNNTDAEDPLTWTNTILPHTDTISQMFDTLTPGGILDDVYVVHDTSTVWSLQAPARARDAEALAKVQAGLWTIDEYREATGKEPIGVAASKVLWIPAGNMPVGNPTDTDAAIELAQKLNPAPAELPPGEGDQAPAPARRELPVGPSNAISANPSSLREIARPARRGQGRRTLGALTARKSLPAGDDDDDTDRGCDQAHDEHPDDALILPLQAQIGAVISQWADNHTDASEARLGGTKARKQTRHWRYEDGTTGTKALDPAYVANGDRWAAELAELLTPVVRTAVDAQVMSFVNTFDPGGTNELPSGRKVEELVAAIVGRTVDAAIGQQARDVERLIEDGESRGESMASMQLRIRGLHNPQWANRIALATATAATEGAKYLAALTTGKRRCTWHTKEDAKVRPLHRRLHGKSRRVGTPFRVAGISIRRPGDPNAPIALTANCRCWLEYHE